MSEKMAIRQYIEEYILQYDDNTEINLQEIELLINSRFYQKVDLEFIESCLTDLSKGTNAPLRKIRSIYGVNLFFRQNRIQRIYRHHEIERKKRFVNTYSR